MRAARVCSYITVSLLAAFAGSSIVFAQSTAPRGDPKVGQTVFMRDGCYQCHGTVGQGSGQRGVSPYGPMLAPKPLPFTVILHQLRTPMDVMPAYSTAILSDQDAANIYAYLASIPTGKDAGSIPLLRVYLRRPNSR
jgi:ubiquinol-cytochrome c reductase cytochrome c subunit